MTATDECHEVSIICPICKQNKSLSIPSSIIDEAKSLATLSIPKNLVCEHHFQAFIDKNFKVRGYQKVDFEFIPQEFNQSLASKGKEKKNVKKKQGRDDNELFKYLKLDGNVVEFNPKLSKNVKKELKNQNSDSLKKTDKTVEQKLEERTLEEIYEDFWEFIEDDNGTFREFIKKDDRRKQLKKNF